MNIFSDPNLDVRSLPHQSGGYEWWYFDGLSADGKYSFVIIFYEGNPFSTRYNALLEDEKSNPMPKDFPAISISIYEDGKTIYYSFTEFEKADCTFSEDRPFVKVDRHQMKGEVSHDTVKYELDLDEQLPSGDKLNASITFESPHSSEAFFEDYNDDTGGHNWNLVQPRAVMKANIRLAAKNEHPQEIAFEGMGYHDHNSGEEPMRNEFTDWYWGRFHFDYGTLVYYVMNQEHGEQHKAWLISSDNGKVLYSFDDIGLEDIGLTLFGLKVARKLSFRSKNAEVQVQQSRVVDNSPFYQRYQSEAFLRIPDTNVVESQSGITEYIYPGRIYTHLFWPFLNMRIQYAAEVPHWVQRSKMLYRWTW